MDKYPKKNDFDFNLINELIFDAQKSNTGL